LSLVGSLAIDAVPRDRQRTVKVVQVRSLNSAGLRAHCQLLLQEGLPPSRRHVGNQEFELSLFDCLAQGTLQRETLHPGRITTLAALGEIEIQFQFPIMPMPVRGVKQIHSLE
jgi:hypothetical protein